MPFLTFVGCAIGVLFFTVMIYAIARGLT